MTNSNPYPIPPYSAAGETDLQREVRAEMRTSLVLFAEAALRDAFPLTRASYEKWLKEAGR